MKNWNFYISGFIIMIEKITVDALTAKAGIGRATYFRNFNAKEEILTAYIVWQWREYEKTHRLKEHRIDAPYRVEQYFAFCQSMKKTNDVIFAQQRQGAILNAYEIIFRDYDLEEQQDTFARAYMAYGLYGVFLKWAKEGYTQTPSEMADIVIHQIVQDYRVAFHAQGRTVLLIQSNST